MALFTFISRMFFSASLLATPVYGQSFDLLLEELSGSDTDRLESERADQEKLDTPLPPPPSSTELASPPEDDDLAVEKNIATNGVTLQGLDKQTGRVFIMDTSINQSIEFGTLKITVQQCEKTPLEDRQDSMAFLTIKEEKPNSPSLPLFSGWMFASSPALSALDHPVYDVWIKECKTLVQ